MAQGISPNPLNDISKVYLDLVSKINKDEEDKIIQKWDDTSVNKVDPDLVLSVDSTVQKEGKLTSVKATTYGMPPEERKALIDAERKRLGVKPKPDKKVEEEVGISSSAAMEKARKEAKLKAKEDEAVKKAQKIKEDRALEIVRANIIKKHGEGAIYDAKRDKPTDAQKKAAAAERQKRQAEKNKAFADRAKKAGYKNPQDYANVVARYGSEDNYKKGRGLGT